MDNNSLRGRRVASEGLGFTDIGLEGSFNSQSCRRRAGGEAEGDTGSVAVEDGDAR